MGGSIDRKTASCVGICLSSFIIRAVRTVLIVSTVCGVAFGQILFVLLAGVTTAWLCWSLRHKGAIVSMLFGNISTHLGIMHSS
jgi:hypothetical protein